MTARLYAERTVRLGLEPLFTARRVAVSDADQPWRELCRAWRPVDDGVRNAAPRSVEQIRGLRGF